MDHRQALYRMREAATYAAQAASEAEEARDDAIRRAHADGGLSIREIAGIVGISSTRVHQIAKRSK